MKIAKIAVENYRLLKKFSIDLEEVLSLIVGKNNTGKTSILSILDKFLNKDKSNFYFDDFNIDFKNELKTLIESSQINEEGFFPMGIKLRIYVEYSDLDSLENVQKIMMDLDPNNNFVVLGFEYVIPLEKLQKLKSDVKEFQKKETDKKTKNSEYELKDIFYFLKSHHAEYFEIKKKSIAYDLSSKEAMEIDFIDLDQRKITIKDILNFQYISARRNVTNQESDKTLSTQTAKIYESKEETENQTDAVEKFKDEIMRTDDSLSTIYEGIFEETIEKVKKFGGIKLNESLIRIESTLQHKELLKGNVTVLYDHNGAKLPEYHNGLGYMNLISMIFEIEILIQNFKRKKNEKPADINLLFIEEPEAHTHPQMQCVFIKNIKSILEEGIKRDDYPERKLQTIVTTHSAHIVSESKFEDIKYLKREGANSVEAKNLKTLKEKYASETTQYEFLKQYLTLNRAEIFFADKVILIEGDTERILFPAFMKKIDLEHPCEGEELALLSQNVSIVEVGAYAHIFEEFIKFVGIKSLIITDLDSVDNEGEACRVKDGVDYSNSAIKAFFKKADDAVYTLEEIKSCTEEQKIKLNGNLYITYQVEEEGINARSFEEAFIQINKEFIISNKETFQGLKNKNALNDAGKDAYALANDCIKKKTHFALDILYHSNDEFSNWKTPLYIKQGLKWLRK